jgi:hypothetical protein
LVETSTNHFRQQFNNSSKNNNTFLHLSFFLDAFEPPDTKHKMNSSEGQQQEQTIDERDIRFLIDFAGLRIPCTDPQYLDYYIQRLAPYDGGYATATLDAFLSFKRTVPNVRKEAHASVGRLVRAVTDTAAFQQFISTPIPTNLSVPSVTTNLYTDQNSGRKFISIDLKSAYFHVTHKVAPEMWLSKATWDEFALSVIPYEFLSSSQFCKPLRNIVLGKLGREFTARANHLCKRHMVELIARLKIDPKSVVCLNKDEIVVPFVSEEETENMRQLLDARWERLEVFELRHIPRRQTLSSSAAETNPNINNKSFAFVKHVFHADGCTSLVLKCVSRQGIIQVINALEGRKDTECPSQDFLFTEIETNSKTKVTETRTVIMPSFY